MPKKLTYEFVKKQLKEKGYVLLSKDYKNSLQKLKCLCASDHVFYIKWGDFQQNHGCAECYGNLKLDHVFVKKFFKNKGCILLSKTYKNSYKKLDYICSNGHIHSIRWDDFKKGSGCPHCRKINSPKGEDHWNWQGGLSIEPYCLVWSDTTYKQSIKDRDSGLCQNPYCYKVVYGRNFSIHHIDYNKKNCSKTNLITLCIGCNNKANKDRAWHTDWYQTLLSNKYGYKYE